MFENYYIPEIRILPSDKATFNSESDFKFFIETIMPKRGGKYYFPNQMINCSHNTLILFQYDARIRAVGILIDFQKDSSIVDERGVSYSGYYLFDLKTLLYLPKPIDDDQMRSIYPEFPRFNQTKQRIPITVLPNLLQLIESSFPNSNTQKSVDIYERQRINRVKEIEKEIEDTPLKGLDKETLIKCRVNQGIFRNGLKKKYKKCCLCDVSEDELLIASHIKPWSVCEPTERLVSDNGLLLCPNHDKLFDRGYISFDENGFIMISESLSDVTCKTMRISLQRIEITGKMEVFLSYHRDNIFIDSNS